MKLYIYQDKIRTIIYSDELIQHRSLDVLASFLSQFSFVGLNSNSFLAKEFLKNKNLVLRMYRIRFSRIVKTDYIKTNEEIYVERQMFPSFLKQFISKEFIINIEKKRKFLNYPTYVEYLKTSKNEDELFQRIVNFISNTIELYGIDSNSMISGKAFDITPSNSIIKDDNSILYFDNEFILKKKIPLSFYAYRVLSGICYDDKFQLYEKLKNKFSLTETYHYWESENMKLCINIDTNNFYMPILGYIPAFWNMGLNKYFNLRSK